MAENIGMKTIIIFDTFLSPDVAAELIKVVGKMDLSPVRYVINSHFDNDHVRGTSHFRRA